MAVPLLLNERGDLSTDALFCFSERGKVLWKHPFNDYVRFAGTDYGPRWLATSLLVTSNGRARSIWCSTGNHPWWPSILFQFDAQGWELNRFVNSGHIGRLNEVQTATGRYILAGGINNEHDCAMLAVLNEATPSGHSPQTAGSQFECQNCPPGQPYRYFLFPRSELNRAIGPAYNSVASLEASEGLIRVVTSEANSTNATSGLPADWAQYALSQSFDPLGVAFSDHYWEDHRRLSAAGKIKHSVENCPERVKPITVRVWSPQSGWTDIKLPPVAAGGD